MSFIMDGKQYTYFDNAATTFPKPESVYEAMDFCNRNYNFNAGRGQYVPASKANKVIQDTRSEIETLFNCTSEQVCNFTDSATTALNIVLHNIEIKEGDTVYITSFEHNAVLRPLYARQKNINFEIVELTFDINECLYDEKRILNQFKDKKPALLVMTHASNTFGFITPISKIATLAKTINDKCIVVIDGAQTSGLIPLELSSGIFDYFIFAGHKTLYGPFGISGFICNKNVDLKSFIIGGTGVDSANKYMPEEIPLRFEPGSHNITAIYGLNAALKEINELGISNIQNIEIENRNKLYNILNRYSNITIIGNNNKNNVGIISCIFKDYAPDEIGGVLDKFNICVRTGLHCAPLGHKLMGTFPAGTVRFAIGRFTNDEDFENLNKVLSYIKENS